MRRRLLASYLTLTIVVLALLEVPLGLQFADHERDQLTTQIERDAVVLSTFVEDALQEGRVANPPPIMRYADESGARVVVVDVDGRAVVDTESSNARDRSFATRPEIIQALTGRDASGVRRSDTLATDLLYVVVPVASAGEVFGAVRVTYPTSELDRRVDRYWWALAAIAGMTLLVATVVGLVLARSVSKPLRRVEVAASAFGSGDLDARVGAPGGPPIVRSLAAAFDGMAARLQDLVVAQDAFVADASHQLRNPMTALRLRLENLGDDVTAAGADDLDAALGEVARLSRIIDGLLALARAERAAAPSSDRPVDIGSLVEDRRDAWLPLADERGITLVAQLPERPIAALVTPDHVVQVIDNLLANALEVSPPASTITMAVADAGAAIEVHVIDEGPGMTDSEREHAFDRFWRSTLTPSRSLGGSGLGLSIVRKLVLADGGDVVLLPAPSGGIDAVVRLRRG